MNLSHISVKRPVTTIMVLLMVVLIGVVSLVGIPMDLFPDIELPVAIVMTTYPNASPEEVENMITEPLESQLAAVEDLDTLYSMSTAGSSVVLVKFSMGTDMNFATLNMREKVALAKGMLPDEATDPMVMKMDMNATPIMQIFISGDMSLSDLYNRVDGDVSDSFERVNGVASVTVSGGVEEEISVMFDQERLAGYGLTLASISQMLSAENLNRPSGTIDKGSTEVIVRTMGEFKSVEDIAQYPLTLPSREIIHLQDIATISQRYQDQDSISRIDGTGSIGIYITKQSTGNTVDVAKSVQKTIDNLREKNPDLTFTVGFDQSEFITSAVSSVANSAVTGAILAVIVIFLFLRNLGSTMVIAISIPTSFLATFILMKYSGMSLNMITLCGLTLGVGMLVDNSVVVLENIFSLNQKLGDAQEAAIIGSKQVYMAVIASTLTSVVVYLPIALSGGISAMMFKDFCYTIIFALAASLVVSLTVVPMLCSRILRKDVHTTYVRIGKFRYKFRIVPYFTKMITALTHFYEEAIRWSLKHRKRTVALCVLIFVISAALIGVVGMELMPAADEGTFTITAEAPYGTSLEDRDKLVSQLEAYVLDLPELEHVTVDIASQSMMGGATNTSTLNVTLVDKSERKRSTKEIVKETKQAFKDFTGTDISVEESSSSSSSMGGGVDMSLTLTGSELEVLEQVGNDLCDQADKIDGVSEAKLDITEGSPEILVHLNRTTASHYGVSAYQLANGLSSALNGSTATKLKVNGDEIEINLSLNDNFQASLDNMKQILITGNSGQSVPVGELASFQYDNSPSTINHTNQQRVMNLNISIDGRDLGSVSQDVLKLVRSYPFPDGYSYDTGGQQDQMIEAFGSLLLALIVSVLLVYMLLAAQFESLILPVIVMMAIPFAMSGSFLALFITGMRLSMPAFIGLIMLIGIVVNNSILLVEFIKLNEQTMERNEAIALAGKTRLRPILMTTITTCVGMIPLSLGLGDGGEMLAPMGVTIIGGLIGSTLVTLLLIPVLYTINDDRRRKANVKKALHMRELEELERQWSREERLALEEK